MTQNEPLFSDMAAELRRAFDQSFAEPAQTARPDAVTFLAVALGGKRHAIRIADIDGLHADAAVTPCPSPMSELRGIAGFRGAIVPVYDLAALLGYPVSEGGWVALAAGRTLAFAFDAFEGHFQVSPEDVGPQSETAGQFFVRAAAAWGEHAYPVIDIPAVAAQVRARAAALTTDKES